MECALEAGVGVVNCIPVFIASDPAWERRFQEKRLPIVGDDIKAQLGATIVHRVLSNLFRQRGVTVSHTYQLNTGGNTDFLNMLDRSRLMSKKESKTEAVQSVMRRAPRRRRHPRRPVATTSRGSTTTSCASCGSKASCSAACR